MKKRNPVLICCLLLLFCQACVEDLQNCARRTGSITEKTFDLDSFSRIEAWDGVNIFLHPAQEQKVVLKAGEHVIRQINLSVQEGTLIVRDENRCDWSRGIQDRELHLYLPSISTIVQNGYGSIASSDSLAVDDLRIEARNGVGSINLTVKGKKAHVVSSRYGTITMEGEMEQLLVQFLSNNAIFEGSKLKANNIEIFQKSNNDFHLYPLKLLHGRLISRGNVYLYHQAEKIDVQITGSGKIIPMY